MTEVKLNVHLIGSYYTELLVRGFLKNHDVNPTDITSIITLYYGRIGKNFRFHTNNNSLYYTKNLNDKSDNNHSNHALIFLKPQLSSLITWNDDDNDKNDKNDKNDSGNFIQITLNSSECHQTNYEFHCGVIGIPKKLNKINSNSIEIENIIKLIMQENKGLEGIFDLDKSLNIESYWLCFVNSKNFHSSQCILLEITSKHRFHATQFHRRGQSNKKYYIGINDSINIRFNKNYLMFNKTGQKDLSTPIKLDYENRNYYAIFSSTICSCNDKGGFEFKVT